MNPGNLLFNPPSGAERASVAERIPKPSAERFEASKETTLSVPEMLSARAAAFYTDVGVSGTLFKNKERKLASTAVHVSETQTVGTLILPRPLSFARAVNRESRAIWGVHQRGCLRRVIRICSCDSFVIIWYLFPYYRNPCDIKKEIKSRPTCGKEINSTRHNWSLRKLNERVSADRVCLVFSQDAFWIIVSI